MKHEIKTINDLFKLATTLPPEKISNLAMDITNSLAVFGGIGEIARKTGQVLPNIVLEKFDWIDDGKNDATINIREEKKQ